MKASFLKLLLPLITLLGMVSCKKNEDNGTCRLKAVHIKTTTQYDATTTLEYDAQGRLARTTTSGSANKSSVFTYRNDSTFITESTASSSTKYIVVKNNTGNLRDLLVFSNTGTISIRVHYDYNGAGKMTVQTTTYGTGNPLIYTTSYNANGDASYATNNSSGSQITYTYHTDKNYQTGDGKGILDLLDYGANAVTNNHLIKSSTTLSGTGSQVVTQYDYAFDGDGRISTLTQTIGTTPTTFDYTYTCD